MRNYDYGYGFKPIRAWGYVGYSLLWAIPVIGWLICFFTAIGGKNRNVRNFARSMFCGLLLIIIVAALLVGAVFLLDVLKVISIPELTKYFQSVWEVVIDLPFLKK